MSSRPSAGSSSGGSIAGLRRKVATSMILPAPNRMWASRNRLPMMRQLRKSARTSSGRPLEAADDLGRVGVDPLVFQGDVVADQARVQVAVGRIRRLARLPRLTGLLPPPAGMRRAHGR